MRLAFADPRNLRLSPLNMHHGRPDPDVSDILPSVRRRGVRAVSAPRSTGEWPWRSVQYTSVAQATQNPGAATSSIRGNW